MNDKEMDFVSQWISKKMEDEKLDHEIIRLISENITGDELNEAELIDDLINYSESLENNEKTH